jgi:mutator protein MutT
MKQVTIGFLVKDNKVLLALKKRGFGEGKWNGFGGKVEGEETVEQSLIREAQEELGITPLEFKKVAELDFHFKDKDNDGHSAAVFLITNWDGRPRESEEMKPKWYSFNNLPFETMWEDDSIWLPDVLEGKSLSADFYFDENMKLINHNLKVINMLKSLNNLTI